MSEIKDKADISKQREEEINECNKLPLDEKLKLFKESSILLKSKNVPDKGENFWSFYCEVCKCTMAGVNDVVFHFKGSRHTQNVSFKKTGEGIYLESRVRGSEGQGKGKKRSNKVSEEESQMQDKLNKIKEPVVVGLEEVVEYKVKNGILPPYYECQGCKVVLAGTALISHLSGRAHRLKYIERHYPQDYQNVSKSNNIFTAIANCTNKIAKEKGRQKMIQMVQDDVTKHPDFKAGASEAADNHSKKGSGSSHQDRNNSGGGRGGNRRDEPSRGGSRGRDRSQDRDSRKRRSDTGVRSRSRDRSNRGGGGSGGPGNKFPRRMDNFERDNFDGNRRQQQQMNSGNLSGGGGHNNETFPGRGGGGGGGANSRNINLQDDIVTTPWAEEDFTGVEGNFWNQNDGFNNDSATNNYPTENEKDFERARFEIERERVEIERERIEHELELVREQREQRERREFEEMEMMRGSENNDGRGGGPFSGRGEDEQEPFRRPLMHEPGMGLNIHSANRNINTRMDQHDPGMNRNIHTDSRNINTREPPPNINRNIHTDNRNIATRIDLHEPPPGINRNINTRMDLGAGPGGPGGPMPPRKSLMGNFPGNNNPGGFLGGPPQQELGGPQALGLGPGAPNRPPLLGGHPNNRQGGHGGPNQERTVILLDTPRGGIEQQQPPMKGNRTLIPENPGLRPTLLGPHGRMRASGEAGGSSEYMGGGGGGGDGYGGRQQGQGHQAANSRYGRDEQFQGDVDKNFNLEKMIHLLLKWEINNDKEASQAVKIIDMLSQALAQYKLKSLSEVMKNALLSRVSSGAASQELESLLGLKSNR